MRREFQETGQEQLFSRALIEQTRQALDRGEQALILLNRRGYSFAVICRACGEKLECQNCADFAHSPQASCRGWGIGARGATAGVPLLRVPAGRFLRAVQVRERDLYYLGAGSEQGEERLGRDLSNRAHRTDGPDTVLAARPGTAAGAAALREINLLVGTQMIAKGHDIHGITLVGVGGLRPRALHARLPCRGAGISVDDAGLGPCRAGRAARGAWWCDLLSDHYAVLPRSRHDYGRLCRARTEVPPLMHYRLLACWPKCWCSRPS